MEVRETDLSTLNPKEMMGFVPHHSNNLPQRGTKTIKIAKIIKFQKSIFLP